MPTQLDSKISQLITTLLQKTKSASQITYLKCKPDYTSSEMNKIHSQFQKTDEISLIKNQAPLRNLRWYKFFIYINMIKSIEEILSFYNDTRRKLILFLYIISTHSFKMEQYCCHLMTAIPCITLAVDPDIRPN